MQEGQWCRWTLEKHHFYGNTKLAERKRGNLPGDIYERQVSAQKIVNMRLEKEKELKTEDELKECTFKPTILKRKEERGAK